MEDTSKVLSGYADLVMARLNSRHQLRELAQHSSVPVINALGKTAGGEGGLHMVVMVMVMVLMMAQILIKEFNNDSFLLMMICIV